MNHTLRHRLTGPAAALGLSLAFLAPIAAFPAGTNPETGVRTGSAGPSPARIESTSAEREAFVKAARDALADTPPLFRDALLYSTATDLEEWHYLRTRHGEERTLVDRHDPTLPGEAHWQLVSIDGREPTDEERRDYEKDRADHSDADERADNENWVRVIVPDSVQSLGSEGGAQRFAYAMQTPDGRREKLFAALEGDLLVVDDAEPAWIREVRLWNTDTLRPALGVRIDSVNLVFRFEHQDGWVVPTELQARWEGEFLMLKDISDEVRFSLDGFRHRDTPAVPVMQATPSP
ncbi:MAG: hypothetical protein V2I57_01550 [Xanthomonadales bacterium]|jgi:hypothetical protein|nr:hypothetical protein [Xanthomonadales bacterium]